MKKEWLKLKNKFFDKAIENSRIFYKTSSDIVKWSFLSVFIGLLVGFGVGSALILLELAIDFANINNPFNFNLYILLPFIMGLSSLIIHKTFKEAAGDGTEEMVRSAVYNDKKLNIFSFFIKQLATYLTITFGGSAGKEAPAAQMGAFFSLIVAKIMHVGHAERIVIIIAGVSAGFAVVFGAPIAAGFFALEALFAGKILYRVLVPSFVSSFVAYWSMHILNVEYIYHPIFIGLVPDLWELLNLIKAVLAGLFFGIVSYVVIAAMNLTNIFAKKNIANPFFKGVIGGIILIFMILLFGEKYLGLGLESINAAFSASSTFHWYDPLLKTLFTSITLGFGGSGGFVTPIFFIGATAGNFFAHFTDANIPLYAALGFVSILAGSTNSPIAAIILAAELFGIEAAHFAAVTATISYLTSSKKSVFAPEIIETIEVKFKKHIESKGK
ncbi:chloride channel protein [Nitrosophilus alvini]|uniref:chloride channel protein n=1 Tax=Nitrosophilus alvini TaxID=2714855 RepID=UPI00190C5DD9|nr:chloride channel protein [Nitrosophilus alvini]